MKLICMSSIIWYFRGIVLGTGQVVGNKRRVNCLVVCSTPFAAAHIRGFPLHSPPFLPDLKFPFKFFLNFQSNSVCIFLYFLLFYSGYPNRDVRHCASSELRDRFRPSQGVPRAFLPIASIVEVLRAFIVAQLELHHSGAGHVTETFGASYPTRWPSSCTIFFFVARLSGSVTSRWPRGATQLASRSTSRLLFETVCP